MAPKSSGFMPATRLYGRARGSLQEVRDEDRDRRAEVRLGGVVEGADQGIVAQRLVHDAALDALAAAVNQPDLVQARVVRGADVFLHDRGDVARLEGVEIQRTVDRDAKRIAHGLMYSAVTVVEIPPRAVKSPTTVIRRGAQAATRSSRIWLVAAS